MGTSGATFLASATRSGLCSAMPTSFTASLLTMLGRCPQACPCTSPMTAILYCCAPSGNEIANNDANKEKRSLFMILLGSSVSLEILDAALPESAAARPETDGRFHGGGHVKK